jgi:hypothetical protein
MVKLLHVSLLFLVLGLSGLTAFAQDPAPKADDDDSSEQVEQREDSYRRQMELEDARSRDRTYIDSTYTPTTKQEKIDKLPAESRDNIRDQLVDIIMENGEWEPRDALEEYPYQPTAAAQADAELMEQEQEAWDEQLEKYHEREAAAFGSYRGPVPGPGNPDGQEGGQQGEGEQGQQGGGQGEGQDGSQGGSEKESGSAGAYQPYQAGSSSSEDEVSTAGVSESALDFLRGGSAQSQQAAQGSQSPGASQTQDEAQAQAESNPRQSEAGQPAEEAAPESPEDEPAQTNDQLAQQNPDQQQSEQQQDASADTSIDLRGVIAIEDLDKLEGTEIVVKPEDP